jgi:hypothetical protein
MPPLGVKKFYLQLKLRSLFKSEIGVASSGKSKSWSLHSRSRKITPEDRYIGTYFGTKSNPLSLCLLNTKRHTKSHEHPKKKRLVRHDFIACLRKENDFHRAKIDENYSQSAKNKHQRPAT